MISQTIDNFYLYILENPWIFCFDCISIFLSCAALFIAKKIHNEFAKNHLKGKQVEHVCKIIEELNKPKIEISFSTITEERATSSVGLTLSVNIFELGQYDKMNIEWNKSYDNELVFLDSKSNQLLDIKEYIYHPLTPRIIADELERFHIPFSEVIKREDQSLSFRNFIELNTGIQKNNNIVGDIREGDLISAKQFNTWLDLKETANSLKKVIEKWFEENGLPESNIRFFRDV